MLLEKVEKWEESFEERCDGDMILEVWRIILPIDKVGKSWLKRKAKEERQRRKRKTKKKHNKERRRAKKEAQKLEGSKKKKRSMDLSDSLSSSLSDSSDSSSSSCTSSSDEMHHRVVDKGINKKAHGTAKDEGGPELRMMNGRRHFKSQGGNWAECRGPPSRPCAKCG